MSYTNTTTLTPTASAAAYAAGAEQAREAITALRSDSKTAGIGTLASVVMDLPTTPEGRRTLAGLMNELEHALA
jgi:hypothetical protein